MDARDFSTDYLAHLKDVLQPPELVEWLDASRDLCRRTSEGGGKLIFAGNGASASIASHYALDYTKQAKMPAISFNDAATITAYGNDYGYEHWVSRAIEHHGRPDDTAILISTSGRSPNMIRAAEAAKSNGLHTMTLTGHSESNPLRGLGDIAYWVDSHAYNVVEAVHSVWLGLLCDLIIGKREYSVSG